MATYDLELDLLLSKTKPRCVDCQNYKIGDNHFGTCRRKAPPWTSVHELMWCGEWHSTIMHRADSAQSRIDNDEPTY